jgi:asparagine synthase (glutamine-hydrolysing)
MDGIWGVKYFSPEARVAEEDLAAMGRKTETKGATARDSVFTAGSAGFGFRCFNGGGFACGFFSPRKEDRAVYAVVAGTIYNREELSSALENKGYKFSASTDAELVVHLYEELGEGFVSGLSGNFAVALWDKAKDLFILSRDQLGIKPVYYSLSGDKLVFATELRSILGYPQAQAGIDIFAVSEYLSFEYVPGPRTMFSQINKLLPAHMLVCRGKETEIKKYWHFSYREDNPGEEEICKKIISGLKEAINRSLAGNGRKGVLLSGGLDSSAIVALMRDLGCSDIATFSAVFKEKAFDESSNSLLISRHFNTKHHQVLIGPEEVSPLLEDVFERLDEPLADASVLPTYCVAALARKAGMEVCLTGDGGDELFGGYDNYVFLPLVRYISRLPGFFKDPLSRIADLLPARGYRGINFKIKKFKSGIGLLPEIAYYAWWGAYGAKEQKELLSGEINDILGSYDPFRVVGRYLPECGGMALLNRVFYMDLKFNLCDGSLRKSESVSRMNCLEARPSFLYPPLVELSASIPYHLKLKGLTKKYIFKKSLKPYLPDRIINVPKKGFDIPLEDWMRKELKNFVFDSLSGETVKKQGFFNYAYIQKLLKEHCSGKANHRQKIWPLVVFTRWYASVAG